MNPAIHELAKAVLKKPLQDCSIEELQHLTQQYPYFGPAQLLLAKKLSIEKDNDLPGYEEQVQKTSLYFPNRVWLDHLLHDYNNSNGITSNITITKDETPIIAKEQYQPAETIINEPMKPETIIEQPKEEITSQQNVFAEEVSTPAEPISEHSTNEDEEEGPAFEINKEKTTELLQAAAEAVSMKTDPGTVNEGLIFEPYHTVDYFASQGIKFKDEEKPKDRFSAQLKSFTEWLKTLKKIPPTEIATSGDLNAEKKVEQMAEYSLAERHVITEAMAEVWKKQGNKARAEEIYRKLSLLDPSKSSYFAAKIEELKKTS